jgi:hypothetical protein
LQWHEQNPEGLQRVKVSEMAIKFLKL